MACPPGHRASSKGRLCQGLVHLKGASLVSLLVTAPIALDRLEVLRDSIATILSVLGKHRRGGS